MKLEDDNYYSSVALGVEVNGCSVELSSGSFSFSHSTRKSHVTCLHASASHHLKRKVKDLSFLSDSGIVPLVKFMMLSAVFRYKLVLNLPKDLPPFTEHQVALLVSEISLKN